MVNKPHNSQQHDQTHTVHTQPVQTLTVGDDGNLLEHFFNESSINEIHFLNLPFTSTPRATTQKDPDFQCSSFKPQSTKEKPKMDISKNSVL